MSHSDRPYGDPSERTNHPKGYTSPFTLVLRRERPDVAWRTIEERSETCP